MNLSRFLNQTDTIAVSLSQTALRAFIHEMARTLPESGRENFLQKLQSIQEGTSLFGLSEFDTSELRGQIAALEDALAAIEHGEVCLTGTWIEGYNDWNDDGEYRFSDPDCLLDTIEDACCLAHRCVDAELYQEGYELFVRLMALEVTTDGDYCDYTGGSMEWGELLHYDLVLVDKREFTLEALYAAWRALPLIKRPPVLFDIFKTASVKDLTLESLLQSGEEELPQWDEFLPQWIEYLGSQTGDLALKLLEEALALQDEEILFLEAARRFVEVHPQLYGQLLQQGLTAGRDKEMLAIGEEALQKIAPTYQVRSEAALLAALYALRLGQRKVAEKCWLEAFRSDTNIVNFLRLRTECGDFSQYRVSVKEIYEQLYQKAELRTDDISAAQRENRLYKTTYYALSFFDGEFKRVLDKGMNVKESLGWSSTFMKTGLALFLLYLYKGDVLRPGLRQMCQMAVDALSFRAEAYEQGLNAMETADSPEDTSSRAEQEPEMTDQEREEEGAVLQEDTQLILSSSMLSEKDSDLSLFWHCFLTWRKDMPMTAAKEEQLLGRLAKWIDRRTEAIIEKSRRGYYRECAAFLAALGEVKEYGGAGGEKEELLQSYRQKYSRRRAFHEELRLFGMLDTHRKR